MEMNKYIVVCKNGGANVAVKDGEHMYLYSPETVGGLKVVRIPATSVSQYPVNLYPGFQVTMVSREVMQMDLMDATGELCGAFPVVAPRIMTQLKAAHAAYSKKIVS